MSVITIGVSALVAGITTKIIATYYFKKVDGYVKEMCEMTAKSKSNDNKHIFFLQICRLKSNKIPVIKRKWIIRWFIEKSNNSFVCFSF